MLVREVAVGELAEFKTGASVVGAGGFLRCGECAEVHLSPVDANSGSPMPGWPLVYALETRLTPTDSIGSVLARSGWTEVAASVVQCVPVAVVDPRACAAADQPVHVQSPPSSRLPVVVRSSVPISIFVLCGAPQMATNQIGVVCINDGELVARQRNQQRRRVVGIGDQGTKSGSLIGVNRLPVTRPTVRRTRVYRGAAGRTRSGMLTGHWIRHPDRSDEDAVPGLLAQRPAFRCLNYSRQGERNV